MKAKKTAVLLYGRSSNMSACYCWLS